MKKFSERMRGVLPEEELPDFFSAMEAMVTQKIKSLRLRRDLSPEQTAVWNPGRMGLEGVPLGSKVPWYENGYFFELKKMSPAPALHPLVAAGIIFIQEAGAMEVVPALDVQSDHLVLDLCAAPGAKSSHIGEYLGGEGWLVTNDPVRERAKKLDQILARHGIGNSTVFNLPPRALAAVFSGVFDRILVDAPCSGESLFAKRQEKRADVSNREVERCAIRQRKILSHAVETLAPGGRLVYSTCAYSRAENEDVVSKILGENSELKLLQEKRRFPHRDRVPGGYFAILEKSGRAEMKERKGKFRQGMQALGTNGLIRHGTERWNGQRDLFAEVMDRKQGGREKFASEWIPVTKEDLVLIFSRNRIEDLKTKSGVIAWEGEPVGLIREGRLEFPSRL